MRVLKKRLGSVPVYSPGLVGVQLIKSELLSRITSQVVPASCGIAAGGLESPARVIDKVASELLSVPARSWIIAGPAIAKDWLVTPFTL